MLVPVSHLLRWRDERLLYRPFDGALERLDPGEREDASGNAAPLSVQAERVALAPPAAFEPECLTLVCRGGCRLSCRYCYAAPAQAAEGQARAVAWPAAPAVSAAARLVARAAARAGRPLVVGLHGHGEPLADRRQVETAVTICREVAAESRVGLILACTTSGVLDPGDAEWLAATFDQVTVSYDGLGGLHDRQRPLAGGGASSRVVERTLEILSGVPMRPGGLAVRATITRASAPHQAAIAAFLLDHFAVSRLLLEPVYAVPGRGSPAAHDLRPDSLAMARGFIEARREARRRGVEPVLAGCRVDEPHGRHCAILQRNLLLTPEGRASACFLDPGNDPDLSPGVTYGAYDPASDRFVLDPRRLEHLLDQATRPDPGCLDCFNLLHCAQRCPERCPVAAREGPGSGPATACDLARRVGLVTLVEAAGLEPGLAELERL